MHLPNSTLLQGGKYKIARFISSGGFGCTYEAEHILLKKKVAIKEFFVKDFCNRDETTSQISVGITSKTALVSKLKSKFIAEAQSLCSLEHPNIVHVFDVFEENGTAYYVMDYIDGPSLNDMVKKDGPMSEQKAVGYIMQVADALKYVHSQNRLHLDIKPGNIMVDENDKAVLIDFGASKQYDEEGGENTSTLLGKTPGYAPLEQMGNDVVKFLPSTDIYALGATLYKLLTGNTPPSASLLASGEMLDAMPSFISEGTRNAITMSMQTNKMKRPQNIDEFEKLLSGDSDESTQIDFEDGNERTFFDEEPVKPAKKKVQGKQKKTQSKTKKPEGVEGKTKDEGSKEKELKDLPKKKFGFLLKLFLFGICTVFAIIAIGIFSASQNETVEKIENTNGSRVVNQTFKDSTGETYTYTGEVRNGLPNGIGEGVYSFGRYVGPYKNGLMHGADGKFTEKGGATFVGSFDNDYYYEGRLTRSDGTYFEGLMKEGVPFQGTEYYKKGTIKKQLR